MTDHPKRSTERSAPGDAARPCGIDSRAITEQGLRGLSYACAMGLLMPWPEESVPSERRDGR